ncbi:hypothetical protein Vadar_013590 [Vaccinium darrowii]|uniref:Uncharacterized protein n=1 Tax=Vaccinium darrowii TaxID=229202 RepID=A0ACB7ZBK3_9ERIC|nr:hypothetical protein Vadar_013590 [Vaccinium darrowii]
MSKLNAPWTQNHYNFVFVSNDDEKYLTFSGINGTLWMWVLTPNGNIVEGVDSLQLGPDDFYNGYELGNGCVTSELPQCRRSNDKFEEKRVDFLPSIATSEYDENSSLSLSDCMESGGGLNFPLAAGINTIGTGEELYYGSFLEFDGGNFTLGFFTTEQTKYTYLGIWYTNDHLQQRKVWVANPDTPLDNTAAALTIDNTTRILKITSGGNTVFNISNQLATNPTAKIEETGNFVLTNGTDLWQSFDNPRNTLLPRMKLGFNRATGQNWNLTSWSSGDFLATGAFTMGWEPTPDSGQLVIYRRGESYWSSGPLKDQTFENMLALNNSSIQYHYNLSSYSMIMRII